jgi:hypothetical protein
LLRKTKATADTLKKQVKVNEAKNQKFRKFCNWSKIRMIQHLKGNVSIDNVKDQIDRINFGWPKIDKSSLTVLKIPEAVLSLMLIIKEHYYLFSYFCRNRNLMLSLA